MIIDWIVIGAYLLLVTVIGCVMTFRTDSAAEFTRAGGRLPGWVVGLSMVGTFVSSISFVSNPGKSFSGNWNAFAFSLSLPLAALIATHWFVDWYRAGESVSAYDPLERRFGRWARLYASGFNVLYHIGRAGTILYAVSLAAGGLLDVPIEWLICGIGLLVIVYTLLGGIEAVIWTDVVQSVILVGGMVLCLFAVVARTTNGLDGILTFAAAADGNRLSLGSVEMTLRSGSFWAVLLAALFINLQNFCADQTYVQRYFTAASDDAARRSVWTGALAYLPISGVLFFIGTALFVFYSTTAELPPGTASDAVLPYFISNELPTGISGLLIAAILAAAMSTVDSSLNSSVTLLLTDFVPSVTDRTLSEAQQLKFLRWATVILGITGVGTGLMLTGVRSVLDTWWELSAILSGGTLGLILLARCSSVRGPRCTLPAALAGIAVIALFAAGRREWAPTALKNLVAPFDPPLAIVFGTVTVFCTALLLNAVFGKKRTPQA